MVIPRMMYQNPVEFYTACGELSPNAPFGDICPHMGTRLTRSTTFGGDFPALRRKNARIISPLSVLLVERGRQ